MKRNIFCTFFCAFVRNCLRLEWYYGLIGASVARVQNGTIQIQSVNLVCARDIFFLLIVIRIFTTAGQITFVFCTE